MEGINQLDRRTSCQILPDQREIFRYMGYRPKSSPAEGLAGKQDSVNVLPSCYPEPHVPRVSGAADPQPHVSNALWASDARIVQKVEHCVKELRRVCRPQFVSRCFPLRMEEKPESGGPVLYLADRIIRSESLYRNLNGCTQAVLFAATLGIGPDRLIARAGVGHVSDMMVYQAASAAMIEAWCDEKNEQIRLAAGREGFGCRPRFSPGYGDFSLEFQADILRILDASRAVGITLTDSLLMAPSKSVTALIGLYPESDGKPAGVQPGARPAYVGRGPGGNNKSAGVQSGADSACAGLESARTELSGDFAARADEEKTTADTPVPEAGISRCRACGKTDCVFRRF